jgi:hypothetical protein
MGRGIWSISLQRLVLSIHLARLRYPLRFDDPGGLYLHVVLRAQYGCSSWGITRFLGRLLDQPGDIHDS